MRVVGVFLLAVLLGCGGSDGGGASAQGNSCGALANQNLQGKIGSQDWIFLAGIAKLDSNQNLSISMWKDAQGSADCSVFLPSGNSVLTTMPNAVGTYNLGSGISSSRTVTLFSSAQFMNYVATEGVFTIDSISGTQVSGTANVCFDSNNYINGNYTLTLCP